MTRRSFFRHFSDKREVLFAGSRANLPRITRLVEEYPADVTARDAVMGAALAAGLVRRGISPADAHSIGVFSAGIFHSAYVRALRSEPAGSFSDQLQASAALIARFLAE